ncbi:MAG: sortase [Clostridiales bacterium]|nr:sortase [Clostridiales bacterium]
MRKNKSASRRDDRRYRTRRRAGTGLTVFGAALLIAALSLLAYDKWDDWRAGQAVAEIQGELEDLDEYSGEYSGELKYSMPEGGIMPTVTIDGYEYIGTLSIPRFGLELPVMGEWSYPGLKISPGRYTGSVWLNDMVICGHNYTRHFGNLKNLDPGDEVTFTDVIGNVFTYEVAETEILMPTDIEKMLDGDWDMTLFTCTIGGRTRVTVRLKRTDGMPFEGD